ncbi:tetratricopeptide repeat protein [Nocardioides guangzhouensis]|uniref:tetratricopeptide repeat protein n=1 Tax=Nocardioides guangzhouensis TaxID=2497878 RepID=UPI001438530C|nr:tetratricopeptide repeat protein [Nocardioides guangzhouensis]
MGTLGTLRADSGDIPEGQRLLEKSRDVFAELNPIDPGLWDGRRAQTLLNLSRVLARQGFFDQALDVARSAVTAAGGLGETSSEALTATRGAALLTEAKLLRELNRPEEALAILEEAAGAFTTLLEAAPAIARDLADLALEPGTSLQTAYPALGDILATTAAVLAEAGHVEAALRYAKGAVDLLLPADEGSVRLRAAAAMSTYASLLDQAGDPSAAVSMARTSVQIAEQCHAEGVPDNAGVLWGSCFNLAVDLVHAHRLTEARAVASDALARIDPPSEDQALWIDRMRSVAELDDAEPDPH